MGRADLPPGCPLSRRQYQTITLIAAGLTRDETAIELNVSRSTVRTHLAKVREILKVPTCEQAVATAGRSGWLDWALREPPPPEPTPLALERPFLHAYLASFDRWLASRQTDQDARRAMDMALYGAALEPKVSDWMRQRRRPRR